MTIITERAAVAPGVSLRPVTLGWALKRALLGLAIIALAMGSVAWLTYASIDPDLEGGDQPRAAKAARMPVAQVGL
jgi:hypothetical protein